MGFLSFLSVGARAAGRVAGRSHEFFFDENWRASNLAVLDGIIMPKLIVYQRTYLDLIDKNLNEMEACLNSGNFGLYKKKVDELAKNVKLNREASKGAFVEKNDLRISIFSSLKKV
jgi:hypothetical protein